jgi:hypothetical protein
LFGRKRRKPPSAAVAAECYFCRRPIAYGEPYVSLNYHVERTRDGHVINVEQAELLLMACMKCAPAPGAIIDAVRSGHPAVGSGG